MSRDFELGVNVSCEQSTVSTPYGANLFHIVILYNWPFCMRVLCKQSY